MLFHEVENSGDGRLLFFLCFSEGLPADVDVEAAGLGLVGTVAQRAGCAQDLRPGHLFLVVLQTHGMRDQLEAIAEGTVVLTVEPLGETDVGLRQDPAGVVTPLAAFVDLQLDSEVSGAGAVEDGFRFVVVALDHVSVCFLQTGQTERLIAVVQIVTVLTVDEAATLGAGHVALVVAGLAEWSVVISGVVSEPDPLAAAGAEGGFILLKKDGIPTYHFAHAIDDHFMRTTTVVRGGEWLASVPIHYELFHVLGFKMPKYAHTAHLMKFDEETGGKRKLSKRKDPELSLDYYRKDGYHPYTMKVYLLTLLNSNFEEWHEKFPDKDINEFPFSGPSFSVCPPLSCDA